MICQSYGACGHQSDNLLNLTVCTLTSSLPLSPPPSHVIITITFSTKELPVISRQVRSFPSFVTSRIARFSTHVEKIPLGFRDFFGAHVNLIVSSPCTFLFFHLLIVIVLIVIFIGSALLEVICPVYYSVSLPAAIWLFIFVISIFLFGGGGGGSCPIEFYVFSLIPRRGG